MKKLTDDTAAELARRCNEKYKANGKEVNPHSEIYVRLNDYERLGKTPEYFEMLMRVSRTMRTKIAELQYLLAMNGRPQAFWDGEYFEEISEEYRAPCSRCGNEMQSSLHIDGYVKFCPNCGAIMGEAREVQDEGL